MKGGVCWEGQRLSLLALFHSGSFTILYQLLLTHSVYGAIDPR